MWIVGHVKELEEEEEGTGRPRCRSEYWADHVSFAACWLLFLTNFGSFPRSRCDTPIISAEKAHHKQL